MLLLCLFFRMCCLVLNLSFTQRLPGKEKKKNGRCGFKKLNCPLACARRCDWWARRSPWRRSWKQELLLTVCGSSQTVWLPFRKVALCPAQNSSRAARTEGLGRRRNVTYVLSGTNNETYSWQVLFNLSRMWRVLFENITQMWEVKSWS